MAEIEKSIVVDVPLRTAYDQWTHEPEPEGTHNPERG